MDTYVKPAAVKIPLRLDGGAHILFYGLWEPSDTGLQDAVGVDGTPDELIINLRNGVTSWPCFDSHPPLIFGTAIILSLQVVLLSDNRPVLQCLGDWPRALMRR
jgi:hypothetical protein